MTNKVCPTAQTADSARLATGITKRGGCAQIIHSGAGAVHWPGDRRIMSPVCQRTLIVMSTCVNASAAVAVSRDLAAYLPRSDSESLLSLGYEPYDVRLCRLGQSPVTALTLAGLLREVAPGLLRLPCLSLSRRVRFTNSFTEPVLDLRVSAPSDRRDARAPACRFIPSPSAHPHGERSRPHGLRSNAPRLPSAHVWEVTGPDDRPAPPPVVTANNGLPSAARLRRLK